MCSQPRGAAPRSPESTLGSEWRPGRRAGRSCSRARKSPTRAPSRRGPRRFAPIPDELDPRVRERLGHDALYAHQADAWEAARRGEHVIVTTGTASGKTLAFNLPVLDALAREPKTRALYLYPTKALAQDQLRTLAALAVPRVKAGDLRRRHAEGDRRWQIRKWANLILTNPDMLHVGVLPHHDRWGDVLQNLRYVVVDEAHVYRGVFGSHVGNVLRRLRRAAAMYGAEPQFLLASATIANPGELAERLLGVRGDRRRRRRRAARRTHRRALEPRAARRGARRARLGARRRVTSAGGAGAARSAHDLLREEPQGS